MFWVALLLFCSSQLSLKLVYGNINASIGIIAGFCDDENLAMLGPCEQLNADTASFIALDNHFNLVDVVIVSWQLCGFFLSVVSECFCNLDVFGGNCEEQLSPP